MPRTLHARETQRIAALQRYKILDTPREGLFDDMTHTLAAACEAPCAMISFIAENRQFFKSEVGLGPDHVPIEEAICATALLEPGPLVEIPDTRLDPRTADNPLCLRPGGVRSYHCALLFSDDRLPIGSLCVVDYVPRHLTDAQRSLIHLMGRQVMTELELRLQLREQAKRQQETDHRVNNSLASVASFVRLCATRSDGDTKAALQRVERRLASITLLHRELGSGGGGDGETVQLDRYLARIFSLFQTSAPSNVVVDLSCAPIVVSATFATALAAVANEFVSNSLKHAFPDDRPGHVQMTVETQPSGRIVATFGDNGVGLAAPASNTAQGLGSRIIKASAEQIGAVLTRPDLGQGHTIQLEFVNS